MGTLKNAQLDGFFTNHSLRRTSTTSLFRQGIDRKLVKEFTSYSSDAVDQYQITSDKQRQEISKVIAGDNTTNQETKKASYVAKEVELTVSNRSNQGIMSCKCNRKEIKMSETAGLA